MKEGYSIKKTYGPLTWTLVLEIVTQAPREHETPSSTFPEGTVSDSNNDEGPVCRHFPREHFKQRGRDDKFVT